MKKTMGLELSRDENELADLMRKSQQGDSNSYVALLNRVSQIVGRFIQNSFQRLGMQTTGGHEDVLQEVLLAIHAKRHTYDPSEFFLPWLYAIAGNLVKNVYRSRGYREKVSLDAPAGESDEGGSLSARLGT